MFRFPPTCWDVKKTSVVIFCEFGSAYKTLLCIWNKLFNFLSGLLILREKKKQNFAGFSGGNSRKNRLISRDFRGKKSKFVEKSADFRDFPRKKVKIRRKIGPFRGILAEKSQISKDFQGQIVRHFKIVSNFTRLTAREIMYNNFEISLVVFMPNITTNHAITYTNLDVWGE